MKYINIYIFLKFVKIKNIYLHSQSIEYIYIYIYIYIYVSISMRIDAYNTHIL